MIKFIDKLKKCSNLKHLKCASSKDISDAEKLLGLSFSAEYKEYLLNYGVAIVNNHEFTGICQSPRLNVVDVTKSKKEINHNIPDNFYLVEDTHFDSAFIWQDERGTIYQSNEYSSPKKICDSLSEYLEL